MSLYSGIFDSFHIGAHSRIFRSRNSNCKLQEILFFGDEGSSKDQELSEIQANERYD
jgi:hypothetical protein